MTPLPTQLRNLLEATVKTARRTAEAAAKVALERLTVGSAEPGSHLSVEERQLRNRLRAHGRQLGDQRDPQTGAQSINRLIQECGYEHWHRMLFARFLAENHLLMHPDGVAVSLAECDELAGDESADYADSHRLDAGENENLRKSVQSADKKSVDGWTLAARYAARMLPQIFRPDDPVLQVGFAPEHKRALEKLVTELPVEVFTAEDSLGWVYQFWQAERKDEVNASGDKITGETLPAVTQLFTEHYMVLFLLHNTLGAWWAARLLSADDTDLHRLETEEEVRKAVSLPGYEFTYLRLIREEVSADCTDDHRLKNEKENNLRKSVQSADEEPAKPADKQYRWKPAAGGFRGWPKSLKDFKLLDPCCGSGHFLVAAFVLLVVMRMQDEKLSAKDACDAVLHENLHGLEIDLRCTQIAAFNLALAAWKFPNLSADDTDERRLNSTEQSNLCKSAQSVDALGFRLLPPLNIACSGLGVNARKEDWLALANGDTRLRSGLEQLYDLFQKAPELGSLINPRRLAHGDLVTASFAEIQPLLTRALQSEKAKRNDELSEIGVAAQGMAQAALMLSASYRLVITNVPYLSRWKHVEVLRDFCERHCDDAKNDLATVFVQRCIDFCSPGGTSACVTPQNWLFLTSYKEMRERMLRGISFGAVARLGAGAFESIGGEVVNVALLAITRTSPVATAAFANWDATCARSIDEKVSVLHSGATRFLTQQSQLSNADSAIGIEQSASLPLLNKFASVYQGLCTSDNPQFVFCYWEVPHISPAWRYLQGAADASAIVDGCSNILLWEDGRGRYYRHAMELKKVGRLGGWKSGGEAWGKRGIAINVTSSQFVNYYLGEYFDNTIAAVICSQPKHFPAIYSFVQSDDYRAAVKEIGQTLSITEYTLLKVPFDLARWQNVAAEQYPNGLPELDSNHPAQWLFNARLVDSTVPLQVGVARLLGYRWPRQTGQTVSGAAPVPDDGLDKSVDEDGIVCIPSVRGEAPAAERLRAFLAAAYGKTWSPAKLDELLSAVDYAGSNLEDWLRNGFFDQHCKLFHQRPFIWHIWDRRKDGFSALVNYHKIDHKLLEKLTYTYLGDWIKKQQEAVANEESGADDRLLKAQQLQDKLKLILEGEAPYDIFVRWKELALQPIGWNPDLNDGVRLNIRPFMTADILRKRPNIKWGKDRGKNPPNSPWGEERDNDRHLTLAEKREAQGKR